MTRDPVAFRRIVGSMNNERLLQMMKAAEAEAYGHLRDLVDEVVEEPDMATWLLHELDARLHPWGPVGEVPEEAGEYWAVLGDGPPSAVVVQKTPTGRWVNSAKGSWHGSWHGSDDEVKQFRFRKRWTPRTHPAPSAVIDG